MFRVAFLFQGIMGIHIQVLGLVKLKKKDKFCFINEYIKLPEHL